MVRKCVVTSVADDGKKKLGAALPPLSFLGMFLNGLDDLAVRQTLLVEQEAARVLHVNVLGAACGRADMCLRFVKHVVTVHNFE